MPVFQKRVWRAATRVHQQLIQQRYQVSLSAFGDSPIHRLRSRLYKARERKWRGAAKRCMAQLQQSIEQASRQLQSLHQDCKSALAQTAPASIGEIYSDLLTLEEEFSEVSFTPSGEIVAVTEPIVLEGVYLGPFAINLNIDQLGSSQQPYQVDALDPHPAACADDVTHPHVQGGGLCEGEGRASIRQALQAGRMLDFFVLVLQVLRNYGVGQAYVEIDDWDGVRCPDCGALTNDDTHVACYSCDHYSCNECMSFCDSCDCPFCTEHIGSCDQCDDNVCRDCLKRCKKCEANLCASCFTDPLCEKCYEKQNPKQPSAV